MAALRMPPWATTRVEGRPLLTMPCKALAPRLSRSHPLSPSPVEATKGWKGLADSGLGYRSFATSKGSPARGPLSRSIQSGSYSMGTSSTSPTIRALSAARTSVLATIRSKVTPERFHCSARDLTWARPTSVSGESYLPSCTSSSSARERPCRIRVTCIGSAN